MTGRHHWRTTGLWLLISVVGLARPHDVHADGWRALSFGPAIGRDTRMGSTSIKSDGMQLVELLAIAHAVPINRILGPDLLRDERYAVEAVADTNSVEQFRTMLQKAIAKHFKLAVHRETRKMDVFVLRRADGARRLRATSESGTSVHGRPGAIAGPATLRGIAHILERDVNAPVLDETGLKGAYAVDLSWERGDAASLTSALKAQLGLDLRRDVRGVEVLVVDRMETHEPLAPWLIAASRWPQLVDQFLQTVSAWLSWPERLQRIFST